MFRRWCAYLAVLLGVMILHVAYEGWLAWLMLAGLLVLPFFSLIISLPAILTMRLTIRNRGTAPAGMALALEVSVRCILTPPPYRCRIQLQNDLTGALMLLEPGDTLPTDHCGHLQLIPSHCRVYDYLGLFFFPVRNAQIAELTLWPKPVPMPEPKQLRRYLSQSLQPKPGGGYAENHELRLYRPGDSLNQIHWKLTAKTGKFMIREAMVPARGRVLLTADLKGDGDTLDRMLGRLLHLGTVLLTEGVHYELHVLTGAGRLHWLVDSELALKNAVSTLLQTPVAEEGSIVGLPVYATWRCHIGGAPDEA